MTMSSSIGEYSTIEQIGKGTFGKIFKAKRKLSETLVALKSVDLRKLNIKDKEHVLSEVEILQTCRHRNLVEFIDSFSTDTHMCIVMELCNAGNLRSYIQDHKGVQKRNGLNEESCVYILKQIAEGLKYLHDKEFIHRDLKTTNILVHIPKGTPEDQPVIKIGDFGLVKVIETVRAPTICVGSPYFMSPEMIDGKPYDKTTDIWSFGCIAYEIATTEVPYQAKEMKLLKENISNIKVNVSKIPYSTDMGGLIMAMMEKDNKKRPSVHTILISLQQFTEKKEKEKETDRRRPYPRNRFASTWSPGQRRPPSDEMYTSGYDSSGGAEIKEGKEVVHVPVKMTDYEKDWMLKANQLQIDISKRLGGDCSRVIEKINAAIEKTKHMDNDTQFVVEMKSLLGKSYERCKCDLGALWGYRRELLIKNFPIAWGCPDQS